MINQYEAYVNWWPGWYALGTIFVFVFCAYSAVYAINDGAMIGSNFYRLRLIRALIGLGLCLALLWPIVLIGWVIVSLPSWLRNESEWDTVMRYEKKRGDFE